MAKKSFASSGANPYEQAAAAFFGDPHKQENIKDTEPFRQEAPASSIVSAASSSTATESTLKLQRRDKKNTLVSFKINDDEYAEFKKLCKDLDYKVGDVLNILIREFMKINK